MVLEIAGTLLGIVLFAIFPTATYLYVEKRSRRHWADVAGARAPGVVRLASWVSLALGQLCILWLVLPVVCGFLVAGLMKIGHGNLLGYGLVVGLGVIALVQAIAGLGLIPFGLRMLARNSGARKRARSLGVVLGVVNGIALALAGATYALMALTDTFHRFIRVGLAFGVAMPVGIYAIASLVLAALMARATSASKE